jgi:glyoxylase-like metal-dependent hydrolase (beta-lactamase superfamily II)
MVQLNYPYAEHPAPGTSIEIAPGVRWLTMPMGGSLNHINLYLLADRNGWWVVDTGLALPSIAELWHTVFARELGGKPVLGVICTHMHPDHVGQAKMITDHFQCPLYMTRAEYYQARAFSAGGSAHHSSWVGREFYLRAGMPADYLDDLRKQWEQRSSDGMSMPECRPAIADSRTATCCRSAATTGRSSSVPVTLPSTPACTARH